MKIPAHGGDFVYSFESELRQAAHPVKLFNTRRFVLNIFINIVNHLIFHIITYDILTRFCNFVNINCSILNEKIGNNCYYKIINRKELYYGKRI